MGECADDVDDAVALAYGGWPDRLYLIGRDGRVAFRLALTPARRPVGHG